MGNLGISELLVIFVIALFVIGPKRLPDLARACGEAVRAFQDALQGRPTDESVATRTSEPDAGDDDQDD